MATFKDAKGRSWPLRPITIGDLDELDNLDLNLDRLGEDLDRLAEVAVDRRKFAALLWWFVGEQVTAAGIEPADFNRALDGDATLAAATAVREAVVDFFPIPPAARAKMLATLAEQTEKAVGAMLTALGSAASAGSSPASPASTPAA
jgi:hypothetical protein